MSDVVINDEAAKEGVLPPVTIDDAAASNNGNGNTGSSNIDIIGQYDFETQVLVPCFKCDDDCWGRGWLLLPDIDEGECAERKNICDNCLLFHGKKVKGSERRFDGKIKIPVPKKKPKKKTKKDVVAIKAKKTMTK